VVFWAASGVDMESGASRSLLTVALLAIAATAASCVHRPPPTSFETLGIPEPEPIAGRAAVILGWAREDRAGWAIDRVRIDGRARPEWDAETQRPAVLYLRPGARVLKIYCSRGDADAQRVRPRPARIDAVADGVVVCSVRVEGDESRLPRLACELPPQRPRPPAPIATSAPWPEAPSREPQASALGAASAPAGDERILERLQAIEDRLTRLEELLRARLPEAGESPRDDARRSLSIDTTPPW
jgi:hypothetical protein